jgi:hypothetical protein
MTFDFGTASRRRLSQYQDALARILQRRQAAQQSYTQDAANINMQHPINLRNLLSNFAGRGMAYSSGYGEGVSNENTGYANQLSGLQSNLNANLSSADIDQNAEANNYNYDISDLQGQQAAYQAQQQQDRVAALASLQQQQAQTALLRARAQQALRPPRPAAPRVVQRGAFGGLRRRF